MNFRNLIQSSVLLYNPCKNLHEFWPFLRNIAIKQSAMMWMPLCHLFRSKGAVSSESESASHPAERDAGIWTDSFHPVTGCRSVTGTAGSCQVHFRSREISSGRVGSIQCQKIEDSGHVICKYCAPFPEFCTNSAHFLSQFFHFKIISGIAVRPCLPH